MTSWRARSFRLVQWGTSFLRLGGSMKASSWDAYPSSRPEHPLITLPDCSGRTPSHHLGRGLQRVTTPNVPWQIDIPCYESSRRLGTGGLPKSKTFEGRF